MGWMEQCTVLLADTPSASSPYGFRKYSIGWRGYCLLWWCRGGLGLPSASPVICVVHTVAHCSPEGIRFRVLTICMEMGGEEDGGGALARARQESAGGHPHKRERGARTSCVLDFEEFVWWCSGVRTPAFGSSNRPRRPP